MFSDRVLDPSALIGGECELRVWAERSANHSAGCRPGGLSVDRPWFAMICGEQVGHVCAAEPGSTQKKGLGFWPNPLSLLGTEGRSRTGTVLPPSDFESDASTNFATPATWRQSIRPGAPFGYRQRSSKPARR